MRIIADDSRATREERWRSTPTSHWSSAGYAAFNAADIETLTELIAEDAVQTMVGDNVVSGEYKGLDHDPRHVRDARRAHERHLLGRRSRRPSPTGTAPSSSCTARPAERNGKRLDNRQALVFKIEGGKVVSLHGLERRHRRSTTAFYSLDEPNSPRVSSRRSEIACFGHCRTACSHFARSSSGGFSCKDVEEVVVADLEDFRDDAHADGVALAEVEVDHDASRPLCLPVAERPMLTRRGRLVTPRDLAASGVHSP